MQIAIRLSNLWCRGVGGGVNDAAGSYFSWVGLSLVLATPKIRGKKLGGILSPWTVADGKHRGGDAYE